MTMTDKTPKFGKFLYTYKKIYNIYFFIVIIVIKKKTYFI